MMNKAWDMNEKEGDKKGNIENMEDKQRLSLDLKRSILKCLGKHTCESGTVFLHLEHRGTVRDLTPLK